MDVIELWWLSIGIFAIVIVVVAVLLALILQAAKQIDRHAADIWTAGKQIAGNTVSIWILQSVNRHLQRIVKSAGAVEKSAASMSEKLDTLGGRH